MVVIKVLLVGIGMTLATMRMSGESEFMRANQIYTQSPTAAYLKLVRAEFMWPFSYYTREFNAIVHNAANTLPPRVILEAINRALKSDPYSANLNVFKVNNELRFGELEAALPPLELLEKTYPEWEQTKSTRKLYNVVGEKITDWREQQKVSKQ